VKRDLDQGSSLDAIADTHFGSWVRYRHAFADYKRLRTPVRSWKSITFLFVGAPGVGKSTLMRLIASRLGSVYTAPQRKPSGCYFDDYAGQDVFLLDEFDGHYMPPTLFNTICDEHECVLPRHGGAGSQLVAKYVFIASNYLPKYWWRKRSPTQLRQTLRRFDAIIFLPTHESLFAKQTLAPLFLPPPPPQPPSSSHLPGSPKIVFPLKNIGYADLADELLGNLDFS